jgi:DNA-binding beta-propeller fold protein YncE
MKKNPPTHVFSPASRGIGVFALVICSAGLSVAVDAKPIIYYASTTSNVETVNALTGGAGQTFASNLFLGASPGAARNIQVDSNDRLLWYADSSGNIRSLRLVTRTAGPTLPSGVLRGVNLGVDRHFSIDPAKNLLYYSATDNSVQVLSLVTLKEVGLIASNRPSIM